MSQHTSCILCNSENLNKLFGYEKAHLYRCGSCGLVFSIEIPTMQQLDEYYQGYGIDGYLSPLTIKRYHELLDKFEPFRKTNKILDVGCGVGYFLEVAKQRGWEVYGTEFSDAQFKISSKKGINMKKGVLNAADYEQGMFDIITSFEVIEHINNPKDELATFNRLLRNGGLVYVTTPNFNSLLRYRLKAAYNIIVYPEHLTYYTPKTLASAFRLSGFIPHKMESTGISLTRLRTSKGTSTQQIISEKSDDEKIRTQVDTRWYLRFAKTTINTVLTFFGKGDSLKGWFTKSRNL